MTCATLVQTIFLVLALVQAHFAMAEEHKAPAAAASAVHAGDAPAPSKPAAVAVAKAEPTSAAKPTASMAAIERKLVDAMPPRKSRALPDDAHAPRRIAVASATSVAARNVAPAQVAETAPHALHWSYEGATGPHAWARLSPEFAKCGNGERQSPIDIREGMKLDLDPIVFEYRPSGFRVIDNGHAIQANVTGWNSMRVMGRRFRLVQFHFHSPSEELIDGRQFDMVVHLVHQDSEGRLAVVAVLVEGGARQPAIQTVLNNLPLEKNQEVVATSNVDLNLILPENRRYFTYMGSLTTPPCSEDVLWIVMKQPIQATAEQLTLFQRMYPMNARPIQSAKGRTIKESN